MTALRTARTCTAVVVLSAAAAAWGCTVSPLLIIPGAWVGAIAWWCASNAYDTHRTTPRECCQLWRHSGRLVHGPGCRRPLLPRRDTVAVYPTDSSVKASPPFPRPAEVLEDEVEKRWGTRPAILADGDALQERAETDRPAVHASLAVCRVMETRTCPTTYAGPCGERPCARFESDDPAPWLDGTT